MTALNKIFGPDGHVSEDMLLRYAAGHLSPAEQHKVERHTLDCELCSDALEGLMLARNKERLPEIIADLNTKIHSKLNTGPKIIRPNFKTYLSMAAGLALVLSLGYFLLKQNDMQNVGMHDDAKDEMDSPAPLADSTAIYLDSGKDVPKSESPDLINGFYKDDKTVANKPVLTEEEGPLPMAPLEDVRQLSRSEGDAAPESENDFKNGEVTLEKNKNADGKFKEPSGYGFSDQNTAPTPQKSGPPPPSDNSKQPGNDGGNKGKEEKEKNVQVDELNKQLNNEIVVLKDVEVKKKGKVSEKQNDDKSFVSGKKEEQKPDANTTTTDVPTYTKTVTDSVTTVTVTSNSTTLNSTYSEPAAYVYYNKKQYTAAIPELVKLTEKDPADLKAHYFSGSAYLETGKPDSALLHFDIVIKTPSSVYYKDAEWGKARAYLMKKDNANAKIWLERVISSGGVHKPEAEQELKKVK